MKLKSLLMGSAAALMTTTMAQAADAVTPEPEPTDSVKVCDMYGAGYFYIPGTETCLKFEGYARTTYEYTDNDEEDADKAWTYRTRLNVRAKEETDLGTLESYIRLQADGGDTDPDPLVDADLGIDRALISLGGFRIGYTDVYWTTNHGYGTPGPIDDAPSGFDQAMLMDYTFSMESLEFTLGIQDELGTGEDMDLYAGMSYAGDEFSVAATLGYTGVSEELSYRVSVTLDMIEDLTLKALYAGKAEEDTVSNFLSSNWEYGVGLNYQATDAVNIYASFYDSDVDDGNAFVLGGSYDVTTNLNVQAETTISEDETSAYRVRVVRSF